MDFIEVLDQVADLLRQRGRLTYRTLKRQFNLDDEALEDLKEELLYAHPVIDEDGRGLVWTGDAAQEPASTNTQAGLSTTEQEREPLSYTPLHLADKILTTRSALEGERKQVTVLFCDLTNSTAFAERIGPEAMHTLLNRFFELALENVHRYEGTINQFLGDGFMALFGAPIAHEDHARRGVLAALALQHTLQAHHAELGELHGVTCQFRIGLNSGIVVVGSIGDNLRMDYSAIGDTTNLASRLQGIAEPGEILVSESTSRLVEGYVRLEALQPVQVKGKTEPVAAFRVMGTLPRRSPVVSRGERTLSEFVGRQRELVALIELFEQVEAGHGQVVGIVAEAGQGKSRLLYEFRQQLQDNQATYLEGRCLSYGKTIPYHPIIDIVRNNCGVTEADSPEAILEKVHVSLNEVGMDAEESAPYLLQLLGVKEGTESIAMLTPEAIRTRTFETLKQMSLQGSQQRPLIFEIEDLHWIDNTSQDYLAALVENLAGASVLLLTTYRPGYRPQWIDKSYATQISLQSLTPQDALMVVHSALHGATLPDQVEQMVIEKAEGNPFFLEELTRVVIEHGDSETDIDVPDTVQGFMMARIDRLPEEPKRLLQMASVLGRAFSPTVLKAIWKGTDSLDSLLLELKRLEFLFERSGAEEPIYVFKHALTQDVAYESLLTTRRQHLHAAAGQALEQLYADRLEDAYDRLAYHYARTDNAAKAIEYLTLLAEKAEHGYADAEAAVSLQEALVYTEKLPEEKRDWVLMDLVTRLAPVLEHLGKHEELKILLRKHEHRLERLQNPTLACRYYLAAANNNGYLGKREYAAQSARLALEQAEQCGDVLLRSVSHYRIADESRRAGNYRQGIEHCQQAIALLEQTDEHRWRGHTHFLLGLLHHNNADFTRAIEHGTQAFSIGGMTRDQRLQTNGSWVTGYSYATSGDWQEGIAWLQRGIAFSPDAFEMSLLMGFLGYAYLEKGDVAEAIPILVEAVQQGDQYLSRTIQTLFRAYLSESYRIAGQLENARKMALEALAISKESKGRRDIGVALRALGRIEYTDGNLAATEPYLQEALETFSSIDSRFELARTHLDLASLAHTQSNQDTATTHLSTAYTWFKKLQVPKWVEKTERLAREYGITLTEVELDVRRLGT